MEKLISDLIYYKCGVLLVFANSILILPVSAILAFLSLLGEKK
jgi:hypothetical protein